MVEGAYYGDDSPVTKSRVYTVKVSPDNLKKVLPTLEKKYTAKVKQGAKKSAEFIVQDYKIRFIETGKKSVKQLDAQVVKKQERASLWIIKRSLKDKIRYTSAEDISKDKKYKELVAIYPDVMEDGWLDSFYAQQKKMLEIFRGKTHLISLPPSNPNVNSLEISNYGYKDNGLTAVRSRILYNLPPGQEFFIYEAKLDSNSNRVPDITKRWSNGLVRFEFSEFLDEANGRNEDFLTWAQAFIPDFIPDPNDINKIIDAEGRLIKSNLIQSPLPDEPGEIWVEDGSTVYDSLTGGTPILIKTWKRAIANLINGENMLIEVDDTFPDYLTYSNEDGSIYGLIKIT